MSAAFDVTLSALLDGGAPLSRAARGAEQFGSAVNRVADAASGAVAFGPLTGALGGFGDEVKVLAQERADAVVELRQAVLDCAEQYRADDDAAAAACDAVDFG